MNPPRLESHPAHVVFLHFPKTAGTTLGNALVKRLQSRLAVSKWEEASPESLEDYHLVHGHILYNQVESGYRERPFLLTQLRHPIERVISLYRMRQRRTDDPEHDVAMELSLQDWVQLGRGTRTYVSQLTDEIITGKGGEQRLRAAPGSDIQRLDLAKRRLDAFDHVGITEHFEYSMLLLAADLGWEPFWEVVSVNTAPTPTTRNDIDQETIKAIELETKDDIELYDFAVQRFRRDLRRLVGVDGDRPSAPGAPPA